MDDYRFLMTLKNRWAFRRTDIVRIAQMLMANGHTEESAKEWLTKYIKWRMNTGIFRFE